jgi:hypothetical protein
MLANKRNSFADNLIFKPQPYSAPLKNYYDYTKSLIRLCFSTPDEYTPFLLPFSPLSASAQSPTSSCAALLPTHLRLWPLLATARNRSLARPIRKVLASTLRNHPWPGQATTPSVEA